MPSNTQELTLPVSRFQLANNAFDPFTPVANFATLVNAQKAHYLANPGVGYSLPISVIQKGRLGRVAEPVTRSRSDNDLTTLVENTTNFSNSITAGWISLKNDMTEYLQNLQQTQGIDNFKEQVLRRAEQAKEAYNQQIDEYTNQIVSIGTNNPNIQNTTLVTYNDVFDSVSIAAQTIEHFFRDLISQVGNAIAAIGQWIDDAITAVGNTVGDAISSVVDVIGDLF